MHNPQAICQWYVHVPAGGPRAAPGHVTIDMHAVRVRPYVRRTCEVAHKPKSTGDLMKPFGRPLAHPQYRTCVASVIVSLSVSSSPSLSTLLGATSLSPLLPPRSLATHALREQRGPPGATRQRAAVVERHGRRRAERCDASAPGRVGRGSGCCTARRRAAQG